MSRNQAVAFPDCPDPAVSIVTIGFGNAPHLISCLESVATGVRSLGYEVIVVLNGTADSVEKDLARRVQGAKVVVSRVNRGFAGACNLGASLATGEYIALLNDDTIVEPGWLEELVAALERRPRVGAVGSRLLHPDGSLQEAGQVIWSDGSTNCVGRDEPEHAHAFEWARRVDYCSGSSLLIRRSTWDRVGGLDESFYPAYCEDVDLCLRIAEGGEEVWYEPNSRVIHLESRSTTSSYKRFLIERNRPLLFARWADEIGRRLDPDPRDPSAIARAVYRALGDPFRLLIIDDRIPIPALGAGFPRMYDFARELAETEDVHVAVLPTATDAGDPSELAAAGIEIVRTPLREHLSEPGTAYDVVVISRPNNFVDNSHVIRSLLPGVPIIYDVEALFHRRMQKQIPFIEDPRLRRELVVDAEEMKQFETAIVAMADHVVCLSEDEAAFVRAIGAPDRVSVKPPLLNGIVPSPAPFAERNDIIMVASWVAGWGSPNCDGLTWFLDEVFPLVQEQVPWATLRVSGADPPVELREQERFGVVFQGHVPNLMDFYGSARAVISPVRFGSGVKIKTVEALQYGVPVVSTEVGAEGIDLHGLAAVEVTDDPAAFARAVAVLLTDPVAWDSQHSHIAKLHDAWSEVGSRGLSWTEIIELVRMRSVNHQTDEHTEASHA